MYIHVDPMTFHESTCSYLCRSVAATLTRHAATQIYCIAFIITKQHTGTYVHTSLALYYYRHSQCVDLHSVIYQKLLCVTKYYKYYVYRWDLPWKHCRKPEINKIGLHAWLFLGIRNWEGIDKYLGGGSVYMGVYGKGGCCHSTGRGGISRGGGYKYHRIHVFFSINNRTSQETKYMVNSIRIAGKNHSLHLKIVSKNNMHQHNISSYHPIHSIRLLQLHKTITHKVFPAE